MLGKLIPQLEVTDAVCAPRKIQVKIFISCPVD
jgi:hypothetical protein